LKARLGVKTNVEVVRRGLRLLADDRPRRHEGSLSPGVSGDALRHAGGDRSP
jgi:hypothetical protein